ncbi:uncharacterized protein [Typha latifolia]|uniref:uncharacterized protein n=1 Tax=Typha latifolia TaxID=4733 RepID=UPI003C2E7E7A
MALRWFFPATSTQIVTDTKVNVVSCVGGGGECPVIKKDHTLSFEGFQMPLHYPRYKKEDYQKMEDWRLDLLLKEYGLVLNGSLEEKRAYAMGTFLWPDQL